MSIEKSNNELYDVLLEMKELVKENNKINNELIDLIKENTDISNELAEMLKKNINETELIKGELEASLTPEQMAKDFGLNVLANIAGNAIKVPTFLNIGK